VDRAAVWRDPRHLVLSLYSWSEWYGTAPCDAARPRREGQAVTAHTRLKTASRRAEASVRAGSGVQPEPGGVHLTSSQRQPASTTLPGRVEGNRTGGGRARDGNRAPPTRPSHARPGGRAPRPLARLPLAPCDRIERPFQLERSGDRRRRNARRPQSGDVERTTRSVHRASTGHPQPIHRPTADLHREWPEA
jgi:hypothetical protein